MAEWYEPVEQEADTFGRHDLIRDAIHAARSIAVVYGGRGIGKTTLIHRICAELYPKASTGSPLGVYLDARRIDLSNGINGALAQLLTAFIKKATGMNEE